MGRAFSWQVACAAAVVLTVCDGTFVSSAQVASTQPRDAITAILAAFDRYDVVAMSAAHSNEKLDELILQLVRHSSFPLKVNDVVVECGNSRYQPILDRYIAGDDVPIEEVRQTWRNTSVLMCALSGFYEGLFRAIRALNRDLPREKRLRVIAGEPAVDWSVTDPPTVAGANRDPALTSIVMTEVLGKHRKALVLYGVGHLWHNERRGTAVSAYETTYPGRTFVIDTHNGFAAFFDLARGHELEARMRSWPVPSIVSVKSSWLADLDLPYFLWPFPRRMAGESYADLVDAYLYLGPGASLTYERAPETILSDQTYIAEISQRFGAVNVEALRRRNLDRALFTPADRAEARQFAPGVECVGTYTSKEGNLRTIEIDYRNGMLSAQWSGSNTWTQLTPDQGPMTYRLMAPDGSARLEFESIRGAVERVTVDQGGVTPKNTLLRSSQR